MDSSIENLVADLSVVDEGKRAAVKKLAGQHYNHQLYWDTLSPDGGGEPTGKIVEAISAEFGSFSEFKEKFNNAATQFGSG